MRQFILLLLIPTLLWAKSVKTGRSFGIEIRFIGLDNKLIKNEFTCILSSMHVSGYQATEKSDTLIVKNGIVKSSLNNGIGLSLYILDRKYCNDFTYDFPVREKDCGGFYTIKLPFIEYDKGDLMGVHSYDSESLTYVANGTGNALNLTSKGSAFVVPSNSLDKDLFIVKKSGDFFLECSDNVFIYKTKSDDFYSFPPAMKHPNKKWSKSISLDIEKGPFYICLYNKSKETYGKGFLRINKSKINNDTLLVVEHDIRFNSRKNSLNLAQLKSYGKKWAQSDKYKVNKYKAQIRCD